MTYSTFYFISVWDGSLGWDTSSDVELDDRDESWLAGLAGYGGTLLAASAPFLGAPGPPECRPVDGF